MVPTLAEYLIGLRCFLRFARDFRCCAGLCEQRGSAHGDSGLWYDEEEGYLNLLDLYPSFAGPIFFWSTNQCTFLANTFASRVHSLNNVGEWRRMVTL